MSEMSNQSQQMPDCLEKSGISIRKAISLTGWFAIATPALGIAFSVNSTLAQVIPDASLGIESSIITPNINIKGFPVDLIDGGAIRGANLFHSFTDFNIGDLQRVYFANPLGIESIFSRVTGNNPSDILGTLGVNGNANLFLLNPNGIIFGQNAQLDIRGSFVASTANAVVFDNGFGFSATNPESPPLLTVNVPIGLQYGLPLPGNITNEGNLAVGGDLILLGGTVNSTGKLAAPTGQIQVVAVDGDGKVQDLSGLSAIIFASNNLILESSQLQTAGDLKLLAGNIVRVRDSVENPFVANAGGNLYIQGNQGIDILALNHPGIPFQSGGNLSLVSDGIISGDAHFASGGVFSILNLLGQPGNFVSLFDPIISSVGDVVLGDYTGVSLKVESMGSITTGNITITGKDTSLVAGSDPDIPILRNSPALILRAGVSELENPPTTSIPVSPTTSIPVSPTTSIPVYSNDFEGEIPSTELSNTLTDTTPAGNRRFLGQFSDKDAVSLTVNNLPPHTQATVSFDLLIIQSWDGNNQNDGPDIWNLSVDGGQTLLNATFSNHNFPLGNEPGYPRFQSYPSNYDPANPVNNPARQGASETANSLGYTFFFWPINETKAFDSVYSLSFTFDHSDSFIKLNFSTPSLKSGIGDESWGLDNLDVSVKPILTSINQLSPESGLPLPTITYLGVASSGNINTGNLSTPGGPVILSAAGDITVNGLVSSRGGNISLDSGGIINTTAGKLDSFSNQNGGAITLTADGDMNLGDITSSGDILGGKIELTSNGIISADGTIVIRSDTFNTGIGGDINITARSLSLTNGARVLLGTFGDGVGGNLKVTASESVELSGTSPDGNILTILSTSTGGSKSAGNLTINTGRLIVRDGAIVGAAASGGGAGGDLTVNADSIELIGTSINGFPSGLSTDTIGTGDAGDLTVNTRRLVARDGAIVSASTYSLGKGGNLTINGAESIELSGTSANGLGSGLYAQAFSDGNAGNLTINNTQNLIVRDGAKVTVAAGTTADARIPNLPSLDFPGGIVGLRIPTYDADATGNAGNIKVTANSIFLNNQGTIIAQTDSSEGGNITLNVRDLLLLRHNSSISTTAGTIQAGGNGGNITINSPFIIAVPSENSDITANAYFGNGGKVNITAQGIYGLGFRPRLTLLSDITASSEFGVNGDVVINTPDIDPSRGLNELPQLRDSGELSKVCQSGSSGSNGEFISSGNGGKPPNPRDLLSSNLGWVDPGIASQNMENNSNNAITNPLATSTSRKIREAQGFATNERGEVVALVVNPSRVTPYTSLSTSVACREGKSDVIPTFSPDRD